MPTTRLIASFSSTIQQNCAWALAISFTNADGSPFDLTGITLTGQFRETATPTATPLASATFTVASPTSGVAVAGLSAHDAGLLPAQENKFSRVTSIVMEIDGAHAGDPNNPFRLGEGAIGVSPGGNASPSASSAPTVPLDSISLVVGAVSAPAARKLIGVNDDAGLIPIAQLPPATAVSPGVMSAEQYSKLESLGFGGWVNAVALSAGPYATGAVAPRGLDLSTLPPALNLGAKVQSAPIEGGGIWPVGMAGWTELSQAIIQTPTQKSWIAAFDMVMPVPVAGASGYVGLKNASGSFYFMLAHAYDSSVAARTCLLVAPSAGTVVLGPVLDGLRHTFALCFDAVTGLLALMRDGLLALTWNIVNVQNLPLMVAVNASTAPMVALSRYVVLTTQ